MVRTYQLATGASVKRVSDVYGGTAGVRSAADDIPYRQLLLSASGAAVTIGAADTVTTSTGLVLATTAAPLSIGPFETGPIKLSDLYAIGAGGTLTILGVPF